MAEFKGKQGHWVTTESGSHIFIEDGGSFEEAVEKAFGKENASKYKKYEERENNARNEAFDDDYESDFEEIIENKNPNEWTLGDMAKWYKNNTLMDVSVKNDTIILQDVDGETYEWDKQEAKYNLSEYLKDEGKLDPDFELENFDEFNDSGFDDDLEDDDWSKWVTKTDKSVPDNWVPDGFDGDRRFYNVKNISGVETVSTSPGGHTRVYTTKGRIDFDSLEEAQKFVNASTKEENNTPKAYRIKGRPKS